MLNNISKYIVKLMVYKYIKISKKKKVKHIFTQLALRMTARFACTLGRPWFRLYVNFRFSLAEWEFFANTNKISILHTFSACSEQSRRNRGTSVTDTCR